MAKQIALAVLGERGTELVAEESAHILVHELGGAAYHSGLQTRGYPGRLGRLSPEQINASVVSDSIFHTPRTSVVAIENTHNTAGGTVVAARRGCRGSGPRPAGSSASGSISTARGSSTQLWRWACLSLSLRPRSTRSRSVFRRVWAVLWAP